MIGLLYLHNNIPVSANSAVLQLGTYSDPIGADGIEMHCVF